jgi:long-chain acyl-CoA synthetase
LNGELGHFKKTFAILASELDVPIVPVVIDGAFRALPKGKRFARLWAKVRVEFLPAVYPEGRSYDAIAALVMNQIQRKLSGNKPD